MRIQKIHIQNYKSLVDFTLEDVKPFTAFVGPNASGKSNIFEALEFMSLLPVYEFKTPYLFGGNDSIISYHHPDFNAQYEYNINLFISFSSQIKIANSLMFVNDTKTGFVGFGDWDKYVSNDENDTTLSFNSLRDYKVLGTIISNLFKRGFEYEEQIEIFFEKFSRLFVSNVNMDRVPLIEKLASSGKNLPQIISKIFQDDNKREDFIEWLRILVPEFKDIVVKQSNIDGSFAFEVIEKSSNKAFPVRLLSDGTKNILTLMAAVYQQEQQFLCIEEPENGLHPQAIELLVDFFREKCEGENGHHIWLNTHSPTLIRCLEIDEVITVNKIDGRTIAKQHHKSDNINIKTDEAWLSNALGGGVSWSK